jgi:hypothetical protein
VTVRYPGALETIGTEWNPVVSGDSLTSNTVFAAARKYGYGRILALGKEEILQNGFIDDLDNMLFIKNSIKWLNGSGKKRIGYSVGHSEYIVKNSITRLTKDLGKDGFTVRQTTLETLKNVSSKLPDVRIIVVEAFQQPNLTFYFYTAPRLF